MLTLINPVERAQPFDHADGVFEAKFDGFRAAADTVRGRLISRNGRRMQRFERVLDLLPKGHVFDGELVVLDDAGRPLFNELLLAYARSAGNPTPIEVVVYPGAYHAWTVPSLATLRFYPEYASTKKCPLILLAARSRPMFLIDGQAQPFNAGSVGKCMDEAPGYSMAYNAAVRAQATADAT